VAGFSRPARTAPSLLPVDQGLQGCTTSARWVRTSGATRQGLTTIPKWLAVLCCLQRQDVAPSLEKNVMGGGGVGGVEPQRLVPDSPCIWCCLGQQRAGELVGFGATSHCDLTLNLATRLHSKSGQTKSCACAQDVTGEILQQRCLWPARNPEAVLAPRACEGRRTAPNVARMPMLISFINSSIVAVWSRYLGAEHNASRRHPSGVQGVCFLCLWPLFLGARQPRRVPSGRLC